MKDIASLPVRLLGLATLGKCFLPGVLSWMHSQVWSVFAEGAVYTNSEHGVSVCIQNWIPMWLSLHRGDDGGDSDSCFQSGFLDSRLLEIEDQASESFYFS